MADIRETEQAFLGCLLAALPGDLAGLAVKAHFFDGPENGRIFQAYFKRLKAVARRRGTKAAALVREAVKAVIRREEGGGQE